MDKYVERKIYGERTIELGRHVEYPFSRCELCGLEIGQCKCRIEDVLNHRAALAAAEKVGNV